ncbi:putative RNA-directed DNA polymerase from transposon X-element [Apostichopus japonicus]|uniref:Putative RNA-directed DNA polymerase from transposon X-element n=1 Tax=Stichopus japonicus TaxID=307972 RepID=A0A2G8KNI4_STIJA|nr:putative RNA-directed DNA polymerase from transposon X-element [Apostichopus japonicus]
MNPNNTDIVGGARSLHYSSETLHNIRRSMQTHTIESRLVDILKEQSILRKHRGTRAGIQNRIRNTQSHNFSFPYGLTANVNSIQGKFLHLEQTVTNMRNLCFITLQETKLQSPNKEWLNEIPQHCVPDEALRMANYFMFRHDRQFSANGGGLITYISKDWAVSYPKVCCSISIPDIELLAVRARPRYLPSDMSNVTIVNVYTRPSSNFSTADKELKSAITKLQKKNPRTHFIIAGDVNRESIACIETMGFKNLVNFATFPSSNSVLDAVYVTGDVYHVKKSHPISTSDHSSVLLIPKYTEKHRAKKQRRSRSQKDLSFDNVRSMQEMLQTTDWNVFREGLR